MAQSLYGALTSRRGSPCGPEPAQPAKMLYQLTLWR